LPIKEQDRLILEAPRDYFTIPVDEILKIRPLMTMVGGDIKALNALLATEWQVEPVGYQYNFEDSEME